MAEARVIGKENTANREQILVKNPSRQFKIKNSHLY